MVNINIAATVAGLQSNFDANVNALTDGSDDMRHVCFYIAAGK